MPLFVELDEVTPTDNKRSDAPSKLVGSAPASTNNNEDEKQLVAFKDIGQYVDLSMAAPMAHGAIRR